MPSAKEQQENKQINKALLEKFDIFEKQIQEIAKDYYKGKDFTLCDTGTKFKYQPPIDIILEQSQFIKDSACHAKYTEFAIQCLYNIVSKFKVIVEKEFGMLYLKTTYDFYANLVAFGYINELDQKIEARVPLVINQHTKQLAEAFILLLDFITEDTKRSEYLIKIAGMFGSHFASLPEMQARMKNFIAVYEAHVKNINTVEGGEKPEVKKAETEPKVETFDTLFTDSPSSARKIESVIIDNTLKSQIRKKIELCGNLVKELQDNKDKNLYDIKSDLINNLFYPSEASAFNLEQVFLINNHDESYTKLSGLLQDIAAYPRMSWYSYEWRWPVESSKGENAKKRIAEAIEILGKYKTYYEEQLKNCASDSNVNKRTSSFLDDVPDRKSLSDNRSTLPEYYSIKEEDVSEVTMKPNEESAKESKFDSKIFASAPKTVKKQSNDEFLQENLTNLYDKFIGQNKKDGALEKYLVNRSKKYAAFDFLDSLIVMFNIKHVPSKIQRQTYVNKLQQKIIDLCAISCPYSQHTLNNSIIAIENIIAEGNTEEIYKPRKNSKDKNALHEDSLRYQLSELQKNLEPIKQKLQEMASNDFESVLNKK